MAADHDLNTKVIVDRADGAVVSVHAMPRSGRNELGTLENQQLRVRIAATASDGAANAALIKFLSEVTSVPRSKIEIISGKSTRHKRILFHGIQAQELINRLGLQKTVLISTE